MVMRKLTQREQVDHQKKENTELRSGENKLLKFLAQKIRAAITVMYVTTLSQDSNLKELEERFLSNHT
jgi:hypothetical protein